MKTISIVGRRFAKRTFDPTTQAHFIEIRAYIRYLYLFSEYWDYAFGDALKIELVDDLTGEVKHEYVVLKFGVDVTWCSEAHYEDTLNG